LPVFTGFLRALDCDVGARLELSALLHQVLVLFGLYEGAVRVLAAESLLGEGVHPSFLGSQGCCGAQLVLSAVEPFLGNRGQIGNLALQVVSEGTNGISILQLWALWVHDVWF
jgi:hypothetical protein